MQQTSCLQIRDPLGNHRGHPYLISADRSTNHGNFRSSELPQNLKRLWSQPAQLQHEASRSGRFRLVKSLGSGISQPALQSQLFCVCHPESPPQRMVDCEHPVCIENRSLFRKPLLSCSIVFIEKFTFSSTCVIIVLNYCSF